MDIKKRLFSVLFILSLCLVPYSVYASSIANHVVISEVYYDEPIGGNTEFVELYNPTNLAVNLTGWKIQYKIATGGLWADKGTLSGSIPAHGYYLEGENDVYTTFGVGPDKIYNSLNLANDGGHIRINNSNSEVIDIFGWGTADSPEGVAGDDAAAGNSSERKSASTHNETEGNGYDTNNNSVDFVNRTTPQPQNSSNATEWDITDPVFNSWVNPSINDTNVSGVLNITVNITDAMLSVNNVSVNFNNINYSMINLSDLWYYTWNTSKNSDGEYNITVYYNDTAGNSNFATLYNTTVDNTPPKVQSFNGYVVNNANLSGTKIINVTVNDTTLTVSYVSFNITNSSGNNILNLTAVKSSDNYSWSNSSFITTNYADGSYNITVFANDTLNNINNSEKISVTIDNTNPYLIIWNGTVVNNSYFNTGIKTINITANDSLTGVKSVEFILSNSSNSSILNLTTVKSNYNWYNESLNVSAYGEGNYSITAYITDYAGNLNSSENITIVIDRTYPVYRNTTMTLNTYNYTDANVNISASINATDLNLENVTCRLNDSTTALAVNTAGNIYNCSGLKATSEADYTLYFDVLDKAGNLNTTGGINFTTKLTTHAALTADSKTISNLNQSNKDILVNATISNTGSSPLYNTTIIIDGLAQYAGADFASAANNSLNCSAKILPGNSCTTMFNLTIVGGIDAGSYEIVWTGNWTNNNLTKVTTESAGDSAGSSFITINSNPQITTSINETKTIDHSTNDTFIIYINSTGNANLQNVNITYTANTLPISWLNITPENFSSIIKSHNETFNVTISVPKATSPANYTGTLMINASNTVSKNISLTVEVSPDYNFNSYPNNTVKYVKSSTTGIVGTVYINNSGNLDQNFTLSYSGTLWTYVADRALTPTSVLVNKSSLGNFSVYYNRTGLKPSYLLTIAIASPYSGVNHTYMNMTIDDTTPTVSITSPSANAYVNGTTKFNVSVNDVNISRVEFYISSTLVFNDTNLTKTYDWNTSAYSDNIYTLTATVYDTSGNYNSTSINATINNTDSAPQLYNNIPTINWSEDTTTTLNLSLYFRSIDGDSLNYTSTNATNVTVSISNSIVTFTPAGNFSGINYIIFYANDTSGNVTASNSVTLNITNVNDLPTVPTLVYPINNAIVYSAAGKVTLNWSTVDADGDAITSYLYFANSTNLTLYTTTTNTYYSLINLNNKTKYYWRVSSYDAINCSGNSSMQSFNVTYDSAPILNNYTPSSSTPSVAENSSLNFSVNVTDPDSGPLNYTWNIDGIINQTNGNNFTYYSGFNDSGTHIIMVNITDNNSNSISNLWTVTVTNTNRVPVLSAISNQTVNENSTLLFNITATDPDLIYGDSLSYSSNLSAITVTRINNTLATVTWAPTNDYVGNNTVKFIVSDGTLNDSKIIIITVNNINDAPTIDSYSPVALNINISENGSQAFSINKSDVDNSSLEVTWKINGTINTSGSDSFTFNAPNSSGKNDFNITVIVSDGSLTASQQWIVTTRSYPVSDEFTEDFSSMNDSELTSIVNVTLTNSDGKIDFGSSVLDLSNLVSLDSAVNIAGGIAAVDTSNYPQLNKSATITLSGLSYGGVPVIYYNSGFGVNSSEITTVCNATTDIACVMVNYTSYPTTNGIVVFNVSHFSSYRVEGGEAPEVVLDITKVRAKSDDPKPDEMVEIKIYIENKGELDIEDIELEVWLEDEDGDVVEDEDGDDLEDDSEFDLDEGDDEGDLDDSDVEFTFKMPADADDGDKYTVYVKACGEDEDGIEHCDNDTLETIEIKRDKHDVEIYSASLNPDTVQCYKNFEVNFGVKNLGKKDEDVVVSITNDEMGISASESFELESGDDDDYKRLLTYTFAVPDDLDKGTYSIKIKAAYGDDAETETLKLVKKSCVVVEEEEEVVQVIATPPANVTETPAEDIESKWSFEYTVLLIILSIIVLGLIVFLIGAIIIKGRY